MSNYSVKSESQLAICINSLNVAKDSDLTNLELDADRLHVDKLETIPVYLSNLSNVVKNDIAKKTVYHELVKKVNAIPTINTSFFSDKTECDVKNKDTGDNVPNHSLYSTTNDFNKLPGRYFDEKLKRANLAADTDVGTGEYRAIENKEKIKNLQTFGLSYFLDNNFFFFW